MWRIVLGVIAAGHILHGALMLCGPELWYNTVPGVPMLGPYNTHFIRDVALVFLGSGGLFVFALWRGTFAFAIAGALWPAMHAVYHLQMWVWRGFAMDEVALVNWLGIQLPAWLALYAALRLHKISQN